jgi:hypothetical protein
MSTQGFARHIVLFAFLAAPRLFAGGSVVPVGTYLYADVDKVPAASGSLELRFTNPAEHRLVIAFGRKYRKDNKSRDGSSESEREAFKPRLAQLREQGRSALFSKLAPDYYDILVVDAEAMTLHEGLALSQNFLAEEGDAQRDKAYQKEIRHSLGLRDDRIGGWEGFFDSKQIERISVVAGRAGVLMQQMRLGTALAESGAVLKGCIHSIDLVWVERALVEGAGWQVIQRQQLYRDEIAARSFFKASYLPELSGIRVATKHKVVADVKLP